MSTTAEDRQWLLPEDIRQIAEEVEAWPAHKKMGFRAFRAADSESPKPRRARKRAGK